MSPSGSSFRPSVGSSSKPDATFTTGNLTALVTPQSVRLEVIWQFITCWEYPGTLRPEHGIFIKLYGDGKLQCNAHIDITADHLGRRLNGKWYSACGNDAWVRLDAHGPGGNVPGSTWAYGLDCGWLSMPQHTRHPGFNTVDEYYFNCWWPA
ncbi:hypothetical protein H2201_000866 [Coniosporium apollinis]|uniref:Uncharacterized protein n=1 Tax=Coniosporium apollinis TaxID=61459 RepID=A0ABQ9P5X5_9PEZI|nr:hypothetical protein H2201_000866 [Coniosporium apollinis]